MVLESRASETEITSSLGTVSSLFHSQPSLQLSEIVMLLEKKSSKLLVPQTIQGKGFDAWKQRNICIEASIDSRMSPQPSTGGLPNSSLPHNNAVLQISYIALQRRILRPTIQQLSHRKKENGTYQIV